MKKLTLWAALLYVPCAFALSPSATIDSIVEKACSENGVAMNSPASDEVFVRRIYLDVAGRIPTHDEVVEFLSSADPKKRSKLIDELLDSEGYVNNLFTFWADILRVNRTANNNQFLTPYYSEFIKDFIRTDKPYDEFVRELLTSDGAAWDTGAIGYYMRDRGMPLDNMSNTARIFLGTRLECAQCHDHPFDEWTQMDYYKMAAFSYGMQSNYRPNFFDEKELRKHLTGKKNDRDKDKQAMRSAFQEVVRPLRYTEIEWNDNGKPLRLPHDYQYDNAKPGDAVAPVTMFGNEAVVRPGERSIDAYAEWLTSSENPRFTTVIANRLWKKVFGLGLIEPVDDMMASTKASNEELMAYLESQMRESNYDLKSFLRTLLNTQTYQREATKEEIFLGQAYYFQGPLLRRMSAEQIWDSFVTLINPEPDTVPVQMESRMESQLENAQKIKASIYALEPKEFVQGLELVAESASEGAERSRELAAQVAEARKNKDEELVRQLSREANRYRATIRNEVRDKIYEPGWQKLVASGEAADTFGADALDDSFMSDPESMMKMMKGKTPDRYDDRKEKREEFRRFEELAQKLEITDPKEQRAFMEFMRKMTPLAQRAANLSSPAPNGHFLREFGQSDRDVIENANDEASLPQALHLLNGPYAEALVNEFGVLARSVKKETSPDARLDVIFLSLYSRYPTADEKAYLMQQIEAFGDQAYKDTVYAILNTQQFIFIQ